MKDEVTLKRKHIKKVIDNADERTVEMVHQLLEEGEREPLDRLAEEDAASLQVSLTQAAKGKLILHNDIKKEYEQWLTK